MKSDFSLLFASLKSSLGKVVQQKSLRKRAKKTSKWSSKCIFETFAKMSRVQSKIDALDDLRVLQLAAFQIRIPFPEMRKTRLIL